MRRPVAASSASHGVRQSQKSTLGDIGNRPPVLPLPGLDLLGHRLHVIRPVHRLPHIQRPAPLNVATARAALARWEPAAGALGLTFRDAALPLPAYGPQGPGWHRSRRGKAVVADHAARVEGFDLDHVEAPHHVRGGLVQRVAVSVGNLPVDGSDRLLSFRRRLLVWSLGRALAEEVLVNALAQRCGVWAGEQGGPVQVTTHGTGEFRNTGLTASRSGTVTGG